VARAKQAPRQPASPPRQPASPAVPSAGASGPPTVTSRLTEVERKTLLPFQVKVAAALQEFQGVFRALLAGKGIDADEWEVVLPLDPQQSHYERRRRSAAPAAAPAASRGEAPFVPAADGQPAALTPLDAPATPGEG